MKRVKSVRLYKRYSVLLRHSEDFTNSKIAKMENLEEHTVGEYIKNYRVKGLEELNLYHSYGNKRRRNSDQEKFKKDFEQLKKCLNSLGDTISFQDNL